MVCRDSELALSTWESPWLLLLPPERERALT